MTNYSVLKRAEPLDEAAERYGTVRRGFMLCPFHADKVPSLKLYGDHFHCFGCGAHGDVVDLAAGLLGCSKAKEYADQASAGGGSYVLPAATPDALGGVKADAVMSTDTQAVRIGSDNKLYTAPGGKSPYEIAVEQGYTGTKEEFDSALAELVDLELRVADLEYKPIAVTAFTVSQTVAELGSTVDSVSLTYSLSKAPAALALDGEEVTPMEQSGTITKAGLALKQDKTWTLTATDEREATASKTAALRFYNGVYYGASPDGWEGLTKTLTNSRGRTFTVDAAAGEYIWYALPKRLGTPVFVVGGFEGGFTLLEETEYTNPSGYTETYQVYRSTNAGLGSTTVTVS